jgi:hypothetical protein
MESSTLEQRLTDKPDIIILTTKGSRMNTQDILDAINSGSMDSDLGKIKDAIALRTPKARAALTINDYNIGARVRFNESTGTRYMVGQYATISGKNRTKVTVRLETPMGRFARVNPTTGAVDSANVTVPIAIIDLV